MSSRTVQRLMEPRSMSRAIRPRRSPTRDLDRTLLLQCEETWLLSFTPRPESLVIAGDLLSSHGPERTLRVRLQVGGSIPLHGFISRVERPFNYRPHRLRQHIMDSFAPGLPRIAESRYRSSILP